MSFLDFLNPIKAIADVAGGLIRDFVPDPAKKLELQQQVLAAQTELQTKAMDLQAQLVQAQRDVIVAEAQGKDWLQRDWRPLFMLFLAVVIGFVVFNGAHDLAGRVIPDDVVTWVLRISAIGVGGYVGEPLIRSFRQGNTNGRSQ